MKRLAAIGALLGLTLTACGGDDSSSTGATEPTSAATDTTGSSSTQPAEPTDTEPTGTEPAGTEPTTSPDTTPAPSSTAAPTTSEPEHVGPVTVPHVFGETMIEKVPERIVSIDVQWTDVLTALGHPPVAAATDPIQGGWYPWQESDGIEQIAIGPDYSIPYEAIAAARPDLIVASWAATDEATYDLLTEIAPTIPLLGDDRQVDPWQDMAATAGQFLGAPEAADALVADAEQLAADVLTALPGLDGKTYTLANYVPGDQIYVVADPNDGASQLFAQLGMQIDPDMLAMDGVGSGRVALSLEQVVDLDTDLLLILTNGADPNELPGWSALPAVLSGAVSDMEYAAVVGLNTPTPLSIPYSLEYIRPALEAAAG